MKYIFILFFLILSHFAIAQDLAIEKEIKTIDSLIYYNQLKQAEKKADHFYDILKKKGNKKLIPQQLELRYQKAVIIDNSFDQGNSLPIFMEVLQEAEKNNLHELLCKTNIRIAFNYEKANNYYLAYQYIEKALKLSKKYNFPELRSTIYIRYSLIHRFLGDTSLGVNEELVNLNVPKDRFTIDSSFYYSRKTIEYAKKYKNEFDLNEAYVTLGLLENEQRKNYEQSTLYKAKTIPYWRKVHNTDYLAIMYVNIAIDKLGQKDYKAMLKYNDSAYQYYDKVTLYYKWALPRVRGMAYEKLGNIDSAYHYIKIAYNDEIERYKKEEVIKTKNLEEQYQNDKKEATIQNKNKQMLLIGSLLGVIAVASVLLFIQNKRINSRNKIINQQLRELSKTLEQKQVLLSELQHRVKNNLQHVISILEIQKESVDFNNIDELIRGNQNRIHSMALLHKKLNVSDNVNDVDLEKYITDLSSLVKESYDTHKKKISLYVKCNINHISIEKALPLGLIITELVSNSMKHAFKKQNIGSINIEISEDNLSGQHQLYYSDTGTGFDFNKTSEKGLGQEIIKGLIDQLDGNATSKNDNGFELIISFK